MARFWRVAWSRLVGFLRPDAALRELDEELEAHLEMATEDKIRQGHSPAEARRLARVELGNLASLREDVRDARGLPWLTSSWLDVKLGLRRLRKTWGLSLVAGLAMTVVISLAVIAVDMLSAIGDTDLPLDDGERVVVVQAWDTGAGEGIGATYRAFEHWRATLRTLDTVGAFRLVERNLSIHEAFDAEQPAEVVEVAEISAAGFEIARAPALVGRTLVAADEHPAAEPVLVIGREVWRSRFADDPRIVGRRVRLDGVPHTIVGVVPEDYGFPIAHRYWTPLRAPGAGARDADDLAIFARLDERASRAVAEAELRRVGPPIEAFDAATAERIELRVVPYTVAFTGGVDRWMIGVVVFFVGLLLVPPCLEVAILVYARTVSRQGEIAARYVLGASRGHIVTQLFVEILVLALLAGVAATGVARFVIWQMLEDLRARGERIPFWFDVGLSPTTVLVVALLAVVAATLAGVVPALRATGRHAQSGLLSLRAPARARLGGVWTALIVAQVAIAGALLPSAAEMTWGTVRSGVLGPGFAADQVLVASLSMADPGPDVSLAERFADRREALARALESSPEIAAVTSAAEVPADEPWARVEVEAATSGTSDELVRSVAQINHVDAAFFDVLDLPLLAGRGFAAGDFAPDGDVVIVNRSFVDEVLAGGEALGRRIRQRSLSGYDPSVEVGADRSFEIVGVVGDLDRNERRQAIYFPAAPHALTTARLALRLRAEPTRAATVLRAATWRLDPSLRLTDVRGLDEVFRQKAFGNYLGASGLVAATLAVLLLSAAGIYALLSFIVDQRRHEIGIRLALGAPGRRLVTAIFGRAIGQVALGALLGVGAAIVIRHLLPAEALGGASIPGVVPAVVALMAGVALASLVGPARRGLRVEPIDELREG